MSEEIQEVIDEIGNSFQAFRTNNDKTVNSLKAEVSSLEKRMDRMAQWPGGGSSNPANGMRSEDHSEHAEKFFAWFRRGDAEANGLRELEVRAGLSTVSDPDGGYLVPTHLDTDLDRLLTDAVAMRRIAKVKNNIRGDYKRPFSQGGSAGGWVGEKDDRPATDGPGLTLFNPPWSELYAMPEVTQKLLDQADFDVEEWILDELATVEEEREGKAFISGSGIGQPKGLLTYDTVANASWTWGNVGFIKSGHASQLNDADKLIDLQHSLKAGYRRNASWLMSDATAATIRKFKDGEGRYIWMPGIVGGTPDTLLGRPVEIDDNMPNIGAGEFPVAFGDFSRAYMIGDHAVGRRLLRDPFTKKGYVRVYQTKRVFGGIINFQAVKLLKIEA